MAQSTTQITDQDRERLSSLLESETPDSEAVADLRRKLDLCAPVTTAKTPADLVTMNSVVRGVLQSGESSDPENVRIVTLAYPHAANARDGAVSILSPLGVQLFGAHVRDIVRWTERSGQECAMLIEEVIFQPEASGDWHL